MTRDEIISKGVTPELAKALALYLRSRMAFGTQLGDATTIINSEGQARGWIKAADEIAALALPKPDENQILLPLYSQPAPR